jgi:CheY-like chemotaxis protein
LSKILIVEDSPDCLTPLKRLLQFAGHEVACARDGVEALVLMGSFRPDRLVTDLMMPGMDGVTLIEAIRGGDGRFARLPIVVYTAWSSAGTDRHLRELGVDAIHSKGGADVEALLGSICRGVDVNDLPESLISS